jgi:hypothetical protein
MCLYLRRQKRYISNSQFDQAVKSCISGSLSIHEQLRLYVFVLTSTETLDFEMQHD